MISGRIIFARRRHRGMNAVAAMLLVAIVAVPALGQRSEQAKRIGKRMMCLCGCNQVLTECNHVGCTVSTELLAKLDQRVALNEPEDLTLQSFVQEYGQRVLAEPPSRGFNRLAVIMPVAALVLGGMVLFALLTRMRRPQAAGADGAPEPRIRSDALERWRRQADRETGE